MTPGAAGTASYHYRGETVAQDETDVAARLAEALRDLTIEIAGYEVRSAMRAAGLPIAGSVRQIVAALLPVVRELGDLRAAEELEAARQYAREATRQGFAEGRGIEFTRHWAATAGWLKHRREALEAGREPDWPDAAYSDALEAALRGEAGR